MGYRSFLIGVGLAGDLLVVLGGYFACFDECGDVGFGVDAFLVVVLDDVTHYLHLRFVRVK